MKTAGADKIPMAFKNGIAVSICFILAILVSCRYLDHAIALQVRDLVLTNRQLAGYVSDLPDLLLLAVVIVTALLWAAYGYHALKRSHDARMMFFLHAGCAVPAAFVLKVVLKYVFGRVNTRFWLHNQHVEEFHWFDGGHNYSGFPSGHMAVVAALLVSLWLYYPRFRPAYLALLLLSGGALIATDYHFLGDVIAGGYLGVLVNSGVRRCLSFRARD